MGRTLGSVTYTSYFRNKFYLKKGRTLGSQGLTKIERGLDTERARLGTLRGFYTERARLGTFRGFCTEPARLGSFRGFLKKFQNLNI